MSEPSAADPLESFAAALSGPDDEIDIARAALEAARLAYPDLEIEPYVEGIDALAARALGSAKGATDPLAQVEALNATLFRQYGLKGASENYYDPKNSFLNEVIDRKLGIPVSLGVLYMAVGARAGIALGGTGMPMHFLVLAATASR